MIQSSFDFHPVVVLRTPAFPFTQQIDKNAIREQLKVSEFAEALYIASPSLYRQSEKWLRGKLKDEREEQKLVLAIAKYIIRSRSRCTPFGLFAGSSTVTWGELDEVALGDKTRHTRLTMSFLRELAQQLSKHELVYPHLYYYPNSSVYTIGDEVRYVEYSSEEGRRSYQISSVAGAEDILTTLTACEDGLPYRKVVEHLTTQNIKKSDAVSFVDALVQAQILVSELEPTVTGIDLLSLIIKVLRRIEEEQADQLLKPLIALLSATEEQLAALVEITDISIETYQQIVSQLKSLATPHDPDALFQINLFRIAKEGTIDQRWQEKIRKAMEVTACFTQSTESQSLKTFKQQFYERYEEMEKPLLSVLDTETGIGYGNGSQQVSSSLIEGVGSSDYGREQRLTQKGMAEQWLLQRIARSAQYGNEAITISRGDAKFLLSQEYVMPPSTSVVFRFIDSDRIYLEGVSGTSAANLLGRFANDDEDIRKITREITDREQSNNPDVVFAEIVHLPGQRVGNILRRPSLRRYELPYLAQSTLPPDQQITLQDLCISIRNGRIVLRSQRLNKVVIPRLSTAHNYTHQALPVYQFLCDLQSQGIDRSLSLNWHPSHYQTKRLPRLSYGQTILGLATWYLLGEEYEHLASGSPADQQIQVSEFAGKWSLPRYFVLVEGDRELLVDTQNELTVQVWIETIRKQDAILLKEFLYNPKESPVVDQQNRPYTNQCIASLVRKGKTYQPILTKPLLNTTVRRTFTLGSSWLYYKLYSGTRSSDKILTEAIKPLIGTLWENGQIDQWFFIRYTDSDDHLRVRFHLVDPAQIGEVIQEVSRYIEPFERSGHVWKSHTDTYRREIERYGASTMALSEALFFQDSQTVVETLVQTQDDSGRSQRWLTAVATVDQWLTLFEYSQTEKHRLMKEIKDRFYEEFGVDKAFKRQIDAKYRTYRDRITTVLQKDYQEDKTLNGIVDGIKQRHQEEVSEVTLDQLVSSYAHMHINRLIPANQRLHELMIYDFLARHYQSVLARI